MQSHLDIAVDDLEAAVAFAFAGGAVLAEVQPQDDVRVCLDPAGTRSACSWRLTAAPATVQWRRSSRSSPATRATRHAGTTHDWYAD